MDKASDFGSEDCEFESRRGHLILFVSHHRVLLFNEKIKKVDVYSLFFLMGLRPIYLVDDRLCLTAFINVGGRIQEIF